VHGRVNGVQVSSVVCVKECTAVLQTDEGPILQGVCTFCWYGCIGMLMVLARICMCCCQEHDAVGTIAMRP